MKTALLLAAIVLGSSASFAGYEYDYKTGNAYSTSGNTTYGSNSRTGSTWTTTTTGTGAQGRDADGNTWNYNKNTGAYWNSNGKTCFGKGQYRTCN